MLWAQWVFPFFSVGFALLTSWVSSLLWEFCIHWFAIMAVLLLSSKNLIFSGSLKWVLSVHLGASHRKIEFFCVQHQGSRTKLIFVHQKKTRFFDSRSKTGIIAHQWNKFSQCTANPAGSQSKTKRKTEKPILLRAFSFFHATNALVGSESEKKVPLTRVTGLGIFQENNTFYIWIFIRVKNSENCIAYTHLHE